jgi:hypothetical protein
MRALRSRARSASCDAAEVPDPAAFTDPENWYGGFYELALRIGDRDDERLQHAVSALWSAAAIAGCYGSADQEPADQESLPATVAALREFGHLRGTMRLPAGRPIVCGCLAFRYDDSPDWLTFYLPLGALARVDRQVGGYPFSPDSGPASLAWRSPLDAWLAQIANKVFGDIDFQLGLIGFELDGDHLAANLNGTAPEQRWVGYLLPVDGQLLYAPANR